MPLHYTEYFVIPLYYNYTLRCYITYLLYTFEIIYRVEIDLLKLYRSLQTPLIEPIIRQVSVTPVV